ncbi:17S U2 SnRNP complex component HTATSF1 [Armigeres subalbatus]|uniref:17S U2 SnRNP complex component HTATSF1 n=1 Tax=Armigeres subalbatus TaxID=124917 RepID=UPI002ECFC6D1
MSDSTEAITITSAAADPISASSADDIAATMNPPGSSASDQVNDNFTTPGSASEAAVVVSAGEVSVFNQKADTLLTDSENTNNENRVIEMESAPNPPVTSETDETIGRSPVEADEEKPSDESDDKSQDKYAEHVTYDEHGEAIYTDPETKYRYKWCKVKNEWVPFESEHYRWCAESEKWIPKENPKETEHYRWCEETNKWIPKQQASEVGSIYSNEDGVHHYRDKEGMVHFWDEERKAWFPKVDDDFMARYQLSYGFGDSSTENKQVESTPKEELIPEEPLSEESAAKAQGKKRKGPPEPPKWFELKPEHNTKVYVSNLPLDITEEEFGEVMSKCGMVLKDGRTNKLKLKLYRDSDGTLKGDGLCHYIKIESVELALSILDNYDIRGHKIRVQQAEFQLKGEYNPALKPKVRKKEKEKIRKMQEALFDWRPEKMRGERSKHERIVIIRNLFEPELFDREVHLLLEYQNDLREECNKCGTCRRVVLFDRHPEGVAQITMSDPEEADLVVKLLNGRFFGKRKLTAEIWDGRTKFRIAETEADVNKRLGNWEKYLEKEEAASDPGAAKKQTSENEPSAVTEATIQEVKISPEVISEKPQTSAVITAEEGADVEPQQCPQTNPQTPPAGDGGDLEDDDSSTVETK